jgi:hypothetical protein
MVVSFAESSRKFKYSPPSASRCPLSPALRSPGRRRVSEGGFIGKFFPGFSAYINVTAIVKLCLPNAEDNFDHAPLPGTRTANVSHNPIQRRGN